MASGFNVPSMATLITRIEGDLNTQLTLWGVDAKLPNTFLNVVARVWAGAVFLLHKHAEFISKQIIPTLAGTVYLERWASLFGLTRSPGVKAIGSTLITGTPATNVPAGTLVERADGVQFATTVAAAIPGGGSLTYALLAVEYGAAGNTDSATTLSLVSPIAGINDDTTRDKIGRAHV